MRAFPRAFTLIEMIIVLSCASIVIPLTFVLLRNVEKDERGALVRADAVTAMRSFSEELRSDLQVMRRSTDDGLVLIGSGDCPRIEYALSEGVIHRRGDEKCGPERAVASHVKVMHVTREGIDLVFSLPTAADANLETRFFLGAPR